MRAWRLPRNPRRKEGGWQSRRVLHAGCLGATRLGKHEPCFPPQARGGWWAERKPLWPAGRGPGPGLAPSVSRAASGENALLSMCPWGQEEGPEALLPPGPGLTRHGPVQVPSLAQPAAASTCCWSPTLPSRCCPSCAPGRAGEGRVSAQH